MPRMLLRLCTADRRDRFVLSVESLADFKEKGKQAQLMSIYSYSCMLYSLLYIRTVHLLFHKLLPFHIQHFLILCGLSLFAKAQAASVDNEGSYCTEIIPCTWP